MKSDSVSSPSFSLLAAVCIFGALGASATTSAQEPAPAPTAPAAPASNAAVSMKLDLVSWGPDIPGLTIKSGPKDKGVTALGFRYSKAISYSGPNVIEIYQTAVAAPEPKVDADGKDLSRKQIREIRESAPPEVEKRRKEKPGLVAIATLPANSKRATVLLAPTKGGLFRAWVIDDDPSKLPLGQLRVHNYAPMKIAMSFNNGKATKEFKTNDSVIVKPENNRIIYELAYQNEGAWTMQENNILTVLADQQAQMIVLKSDEGFFTSGDGSRSGFLQTVVLRRGKDDPEEKETP